MDEQNKYCPDSNLVWAILCTILCCLPLGIVAIVKATSVEKLWNQGRHHEAQRAAEDAKKYSIWGAVIAAVGMFLYVLVLLFAVFAGTM